MADTQQATVHLRRAFDLLSQVEAKTDALQKQAAAHSVTLDQDGSFLAGMAATFASARALSGEKGKLLSDVQLASGEIDRAGSLDPNVTIDSGEGSLVTPTSLRCSALLVRGNIELIYGTAEAAKQLFEQSLQVVETPDAHYMLGLIHEDEYKPTEALVQFEQYLAMEPNGEYSVSALREANAMRNYKKRFRGSWLVLGLLLLCFFPAVPIYFYLKWK